MTDLIGGIPERLFPVGRLDYDSEGLLILTNDGEFSQRLQHPRYKLPKSYRVKVEGNLRRSELQDLESGTDLPDGRFTPANVVVERTNRGSTWLRLTILEGRNRVIRRAFEALGHPVCRLIRVAVGEVALGAVPEGAWRMLSRREVNRLLQQTGQLTPGEKWTPGEKLS